MAWQLQLKKLPNGLGPNEFGMELRMLLGPPSVRTGSRKWKHKWDVRYYAYRTEITFWDKELYTFCLLKYDQSQWFKPSN